MKKEKDKPVIISEGMEITHLMGSYKANNYLQKDLINLQEQPFNLSLPANQDK
ncbi:MAG: hypothetical protein GPJ51_07640 [Candidatus Heimdallarchaeota archaeon]|nr:hypothetical protein [Candidatus Heimdallarchaeota archaeon]